MTFNASEQHAVTQILEKPGLAEGTTSATIQFTAGADYAINGIIFNKAVTNNIPVTPHEAQEPGTSCIYAVQVDDTGVVSTVKGREVETAELGRGLQLEWPRAEERQCLFGAYRVDTDLVTSFVNGTTDLSATGITTKFFDLAGVPDRSLVV